ncbi:fimbrial protein [Citrobacter arsenatis]|uniref:fimbrial protein n=1 Tax=Citrobacter arsenatis TaxID=2546350 RepID=UPI00300E1D18
MNKLVFTLLFLLIGILQPIFAWADNPFSSTGTFSANIIAGTCTATVIAANGASGNSIDLGEIYLSEIVKKTDVIPFSLKFSGCLGVAKIAISNLAGQCSGSAATDSSFGNQLMGADASVGVGLDIWGNDVNSGTLFDCHNPKDNNVVITLAPTPVINPVDYIQNMHAQLVESSDASVSLAAGDFSAAVSFTVTYE